MYEKYYLTATIACSFLLTACSTTCTHFVDYQSKKVNLSGIQTKLGEKTSANVGSVSIDTTNREASEQIQQYDAIQYNICTTLKDMPDGPDKQNLQKEYIHNLMELQKLAINNTSKSSGEQVKKPDEPIFEEYGKYAMYDVMGYERSPGIRAINGIIVDQSPLEDWNKDFVRRSGDDFNCNCNVSSATKTCQTMISGYPLYPFPYYFLSICLKGKGDPSWREPALRAKSILDKTTKLPQHFKDHDLILEKVNKLLEEG